MNRKQTFGSIFALCSLVSPLVNAQTPRIDTQRDAVEQAQTPRDAPAKRIEQQKNSHDQSDVFKATNAKPSSPALDDQPDKGRINSFDFARDGLNSKRPMQPAEEIMKQDIADKPKVTAAQRKLLEGRYDLKPKLDPKAKMSRGKPLAVGPTARLANGVSWENLAAMKPEEIRSRNIFPYPSLPHPKHSPGGMVFPQLQIEMFPRLERFDVEFYLPEVFLPEFPPAIFLQNRPELGDVSRGEVVSINNFHRLFKDILTPVQLDGLRMLVTPFPQEEFNATDDRKSADPSLGVTCLDCHVNGHTTGHFNSIRMTGPKSGDSVSIRRACAQCSTSKSTVPSAACAQSKTLPSSSSAPRTSTVIRSTR